MTNATETAALLLAGLVREGGATVPTKNNDAVPTTGYAIGGHNTRRLHRSEVALWAVEAWVIDTLDSRFVGAWADGDFVYLDGVTVLPAGSKYAALAAARDLGECAIYCFDTHQTISLTV